MSHSPDISVSRARGFSLVELMVAVVIGLLVLAAVSTVMVNSKKNYTIQDSLARLQENARVAVDFVTRDLRMAGYYGCSNDYAAVKNSVTITGSNSWDSSPQANSLYDVNHRIEAVENGGASAATTWYPSGITNKNLNLTGIVPGTDALTLRFMDGADMWSVQPVTAGPPPGYASASTEALKIVPPGSSKLKTSDIVMVADCASTDVFQITSDAPGTSGTLAHADGATSPGNVTDELGKDKIYENNSFVAKLMAVRYFVGARCATTGAKCATGENNGDLCTKDNSCKCDHEHRCSLFRQIGGPSSGSPQELVEGIESMQVLYGKDTDTPADGVPNVYVSGDNVGNAGEWRRVVSVRIGLLAYTQASETESGEYGGVTDKDQQYDVNGTVLTSVGADATKNEADATKNEIEAKRVKRRVFTTTVALRNQQ